jgi:heme/copper-type cytochrome/quinol oxidase subunit 3
MANAAASPRPDLPAGHPGSGDPGPAAEEAVFYHESALNAAWTGTRLAIGGLSFLFGAFVFAFFYLRSVDSAGRWHGSGYHAPPMLWGTCIAFLVLVSAAVHYAALQQIKSGNKKLWQAGGLIALCLGLAAVGLQISELLYLPFWPGSSGYSSVFAGFYPVFLVILLAAMIWLEILLARSRFIPAISFVEQPPTHGETFEVQRFQASLSSFATMWNYLAAMALLFWVLFYVFA